jgi:hypothetical protein
MGERPKGPQLDWDPDGDQRSDRQKALAQDIIARYQQHEREGTLPRGGRGIFYDLRPTGMGHGLTYRKKNTEPQEFGDMEAHETHVADLLLMLRRALIIPESWVADAHAPDPLIIPSYDDAQDFASETMARAQEFQPNLQKDQDVYLVLWCEAADLMPRITQISTPYGVNVFSGGGSDGLKIKTRIAREAASRGIPTIIGHIGDRDDAGERNIYRPLVRDTVAWVEKWFGLAKPDGWLPQGIPSRPGGWLDWKRLALTVQQARDWDLLDDHGKAEADGIPVPELDALLRRWFRQHLDADIRRQVKGEWLSERQALPQAIAEAVADMTWPEDTDPDD